MTLVRFYVLKTDESAKRLDFLCRLAEKAQQQEAKMHILCADDSMAHDLDRRLWDFKDTAFLPHCFEGEGEADILLSVFPNRVQSASVFVNLSYELQIDIPQKCEKIFELVTQEALVLQSTRARYKLYKEYNFPIEMVNI